jgi:hypothetical protein
LGNTHTPERAVWYVRLRRAKATLGLENAHASTNKLGIKRHLDFWTLNDRPLLVLKYNMTMSFQMFWHEQVRSSDGTAPGREKAKSSIQLIKMFQGHMARVQCSFSDRTVFEEKRLRHDIPIGKPIIVVGQVR